MTATKKLKKAIRARAAKTGESYTAARRHVLLARDKREPAAVPPKPPVKPAIGEASVLKATGHAYDHWFGLLDAFGALIKGHTASAAHLMKDHGVPGWHAQMITVAYERARGKRVPNQSCKGDFQVGISKAVDGCVAEVAAALSDGRWLAGVDPELARAFPRPAKVVVRDAKLARLRYRWGASTIQISIAARKGGCTVVADNMKLAGTSEVERRRSQWRRALEALRASLAK